MSNYWEPIEAEWQSHYAKEFLEMLDLVSDTHQLVADLAQHPDLTGAPITESLYVERLLLRRLGEELRGVELLALYGHGFQAVSAASNLFEQSHFLTYVSADPSSAKEFLGWTDLKYSLDKVINVVTRSGKQRGWDTKRIDDEYGKYRLLCGFKHNNPRFQVLLTLPGDPDVFLCKLALADSVWFILSAIGVLAIERLLDESVPPFFERCNTLMERAIELIPDFPANDTDIN